MTLLVGSIFHMTRKIVSEMTCNVSMGTLNPTIPYHTGFASSQAARVRRSLDIESVKTLVHAFVTSRVDYCNSMLDGAKKSTTDKVQRTEVRPDLVMHIYWILTCTGSHAYLLDIRQRVQYKLGLIVSATQESSYEYTWWTAAHSSLTLPVVDTYSMRA